MARRDGRPRRARRRPSRVLDVACGPGGGDRRARRGDLRRDRRPRPQRGHARPGRGATSSARGLAERISLVLGRGEQLPFADASFDALTFTYLLRYVADPAATIAELARVVRPGGAIASLEFAVPPRPFWHAWWSATPGSCCPSPGSSPVVGRGTRSGRFLGPSISRHYERLPGRLDARRMAARGHRARRAPAHEPRRRPRHVGHPREPMRPTDDAGRERAAGTRLLRPADVPAPPWARDWWTLLHPPYTAWHLAYVVIGACLLAPVSLTRLLGHAPRLLPRRRLGAHALDELHGRPLRHRDPRLGARRRPPSSGSAAPPSIGDRGAIATSAPWLGAFIAVGVVLARRLQPRAVRRRAARRRRVRRVTGAPSRSSPPTSPNTAAERRSGVRGGLRVRERHRAATAVHAGSRDPPAQRGRRGHGPGGRRHHDRAHRARPSSARSRRPCGRSAGRWSPSRSRSRSRASPPDSASPPPPQHDALGGSSRGRAVRRATAGIHASTAIRHHARGIVVMLRFA